MSQIHSQEEYIEQAYFFRTLRERLESNLAAQEVLDHLHEEILATTRLPYAIQFLAAELRHTGLLSSGFERLPHYFTPFQAFVVRQSEKEGIRFNLEPALLVLEREAQYRAGSFTPTGMFFYQFEVLSRNRLGYDEGMRMMAEDACYDAAWREYIDLVRRQVGAVDLGDIIYLRSEQYVQDQRRTDPGYEPPVPALIGEKEGRIAKANRRRDPLFLFAALQRQLGYPPIPRPQPPNDTASKLHALQVKYQQMEARLKLIEGELRGQIDLSQFGKPEMFEDWDDG